MDAKSLQPGNGYRVPPEAYFGVEWFEREQQQLFPRMWNFVCTTNDVSEAGAYFTATVGPYPILVVRGEDAEVRAFHNLCRHRGAVMLDEKGSCSRIICPYHRWQYGLNGELENVPQGDQQIPLLNKSDWGLQPVRMAVWMGMIFVNPDGQAASFDSWSGRLSEYLNSYKLEDLTELAQEEYLFEANWKFYIENHIDWYHLWYTHAKTLSSLNHNQGIMHQLGQHWVSFEPFKNPSNQQQPFKPIAWLNDQCRLNGAHFMFPNLTLFGGESWFGTGHLTPLAPDRTLMSFRLFALPGQDPTSFLAGFKQVTQVEDAQAARRMQAGVKSPAFSVGPLTRDYERPITCFHDAYLDAMSA